MEKGKFRNNVKTSHSLRQKMRRKEAGITLLSLVVTIIIMIILASVSIPILRNTGLLSTSKRVADDYKRAEEEEMLRIAFANVFSKSILADKEITPEDLEEELKKNGVDATVTPDEENPDILHVKIEETGNDHTIDITTGEINKDDTQNPDNPDKPIDPNDPEVVNDKTPPTITLGTNSNENWSKAASVKVTVSDNASGLEEGARIQYGWSISSTLEPTEYTPARLSYSKGTRSTSFTATSSGLTGKYYLWVVPENLQDVKGNKQEATYKSTGMFYFDNTKPVVTEVTAAGNNITFSSTDETGIVAYAVTTTNTAPALSATGGTEGNDGLGKWISCDATTEIANKTLSGYRSGTYYVWTRDSAGNISEGKGTTAEGIVAPSKDNLTQTITWPTTEPSDGSEPKATIDFETNTGLTIEVSKDGGKTWEETNSVEVESGEEVLIRYKDPSGNTSESIKAEVPVLEYTIAYDGNGATGGATASSKHKYKEEKRLTDNGFTKTGFRFKGWNTQANGSGNSYENGQTVLNLSKINGATVTLYAQWEEATHPEADYRVEHYQMGLDGNYSSTPTDTESKRGTATTTATSSPKDYGAGFTVERNENVGAQIAEDGSLVIKYYYERKKFSFTRPESVNGITITGSTSREYYYGAKITLTAIPDKGYEFSGWEYTGITNPQIDGATITFDMPASEVTLTIPEKGDGSEEGPGVGKIKYQITYDLAGGTLAEGKTNPDYYTITSEAITLNNPTKPGSRFLGWLEEGATEAKTEVIIPTGSTGNKKYTATWEVNQYALIIGTTKGVTLTEDSSVAGNYAYGTEITLKATVQPGYTWEGWRSTNENIEETTELEITFTMPMGDVTMTPTVTANTYTITLNNHEATAPGTTAIYEKYDTGIYTNQNCTEDKKMTTTENAITPPQKTGYQFKGYYTEENGKGVQMIAENGYKTTSLTQTYYTDNANLHAYWVADDAVQYTIEHYQMGLDGAYPTVATESETGTGETGTPAVSAPKTYLGFTEDESKRTPANPTIAADGSLVIRYYYQRNKYALERPDNVTGITITGSTSREYYYGADISVTASASEGYIFSGWEYTGISNPTIVGGNIRFQMPAGDVTLTIPTKSGEGSEEGPGVGKVKYPIVYDLAGGSVTPENANPSTYTIEDTITLVNPTKEGHTFAGWTGTGITGTTNTVTIPTGSTGARSYTATWTVDRYTFTLGVGAGVNTTGSTTTGSYRVGDKITVKAEANPGYTWVGWTSSNPDLVANSEQAELTFDMPTGNLTMTPVATANTYTITLNNQDATTAGTGHIYEKYDTGIYLNQECTDLMTADENAIEVPQKTGYHFKGYYTEANGQGNQMIAESGYKTTSLMQTVYTNNATLYAYWIPDGAITYTVEHYQMDVNGNYPETATSKEDKTGATGSVASSAPKTYTGFTEDQTKREHVGDKVLADGSLVIKYYYERNKYLFTRGTASGVTFDSESSTTGEKYFGATIVLNATVANGYIWGGWTSDNASVSNKAEKNITFTMPAGAIKMTPKTTLESYTIRYNLNGGTVAPANPTSYNITTNTFTLNNPTKPGYEFLGWTGSNGQNASTNVSIQKGSTGTKEYTANWSETPLSYTISYNLNGGTVSPANPTSYTVETDEITLHNPTKTNYTFIGWSGTGLTGNTNKTVTIPKGSTGNRSYTANFTENVYTITLRNYDDTATVDTIYLKYGVGLYKDSNCSTAQKMSTTANPAAIPTPGAGYNFSGYFTAKNGAGTKRIGENGYIMSNFSTTAYTANTTLYAHRTGQDGIKYTVEHYQKGIGANASYTKSDTETKYGVTGQAAVSEAKNTETDYKGFTFERSENVGAAITADGNLVIKYYYTRNQYRFTAPSGVDGITITGTATGDYYYGQTITLTATPKPGYTFSGWNYSGLDNVTTEGGTITFTMPAGDVTFGNTTGDIILTIPTKPDGGTEGPGVGKVKYTISYNLNGGALATGETNPTEYTVEDTFTLKNPTKAGYSFAGWTGTGITGSSTSVTVAAGNTGNRSYTATWTANERKLTVGVASGVTVTATKNGTTISGNGSGNHAYGSSITLTATVNSGYTWNGWSSSQVTGTTSQTITFTMPDRDVTVNSSTIARIYTFTLKNGTTEVGKIYGKYNSGFYTDAACTTANKITTIPQSLIPSNSGYNFGGYYTASSGGTQRIDSNGRIAMTATTYTGTTTSITLYARWNAGTPYSIQYYKMDVNGAYLAAPTVENKAGTTGAKVSVPTINTDKDGQYTGFTFAKVEVQTSSGTTASTLATVGNTTIQADGQLKINYYFSRNKYTLTLNKGEGITTTGAKAEYYHGATVSITAKAGTGYKLTGWTCSDTNYNKTVADGTTTDTISFEMPAKNITLTAGSSAISYTISYTTGGGSIKSGTGTGIAEGKLPASYTVKNTPFTLPELQKTGYDFLGWTGSNGSTAQTTVTVAAGSTGTKTYTANWSVKQYSFTLGTGTGVNTTGSTQSGMYNYGATITLKATANTGYTWKQWTSTNSDVPSRTTANFTFTMPAGNVTMTPSATANRCTITLNNQGADTGKGGTAAIYSQYASGVYLNSNLTNAMSSSANPITVPVKSGWVFQGYYTDQNGQGTQRIQANGYKNSSLTSTTYSSTAPQTLYAYWTPSNSVTYKVEHYQMQFAENSYLLYETETKTNGTTGQPATSAPKVYTGFTEETAKRVNVGANVTAPDVLVIKYYYKRNKYSYTLGSATGASTTGSTGSGTYYYKADITLSAATNSGYDWQQWTSSNPNLQAHIAAKNPGKIQMPAGTLTMTPKVSLHTYNITYNLNGATSPTPDNPTSYNVTTSTITLRTPIKPGYTFEGWSGTGISGTTTNPVTIPQGSTGDRQYTAHWSTNPITYTISYSLNGGSATNPNSYNVNTNTITLNNPTRTGYNFTGWTGSNGSTPQMTVTIPKGSTGNKSYTANWSEPISYTIGYTLNGGSATNPTSYNVTTNTITLNAPTRTGYTFTGWTGSNGSTPQTSVTIPKGSTGNKSYTANWSEPIAYTISYTLNGGSATNPTSYNVTSNAITLNNPTRTGYTFAGWSGTGLSGTTNKSVTIPAGSTGNRSYTANWTANVYTITLKNYDGTVTADTIYLKYGDGYYKDQGCTSSKKMTTTANASAIPAPGAGYDFKGYFTSKNGGGTKKTGENGCVVSGISTTDTTNLTWYAHRAAQSGIRYTVEHYQQGIGASAAYTKYETETNYGTTGTVATSSAKTYVGFSYARAENAGAAIKGDGSLVIKYYYTRNQYKFTLGTVPSTGVSTAGTSATGTYYFGANITLSAAATTGYTWNGWTITGTGTGTETGKLNVSNLNLKATPIKFTMPAGDITASIANSAVTVNKYKFTLGSATGVSTTGSTQTTAEVPFGTTITLKATANTGYSWKQWTSSNTNLQGNITTANTTFQMPAGDITMTPTVTAHKYTVQYFDGGTTAIGSSSYTYGVAQNLKTIAALNRTREGFSFYGWAIENNKNTVVRSYTDGQSVNKLTSTNGGTFNLYAIWQRGTNFYAGTNKTTPIAQPTQYFNSTAGLYSVATPAVTAMTSWNIRGWSNETTATGSVVAQSGAVSSSSNNTFYAVYERSLKIRYYDQLSNKTVESQSKVQYYNSSGALQNPGAFGLESGSIFSRTGYRITHWIKNGGVGNTENLNLGASYTFAPAVTATGTVLELYPRWEAIEYTITLIDAPGVTTPIKYTVETSNFNLPTPSKNNYTFVGWSGTGLSGTSNKIVTIAKGTTGDKTYTANWSGNVYRITLDNDGGTPGSGAPTAIYEKYGTGIYLESNCSTLLSERAANFNAPTKEGYIFDGYWTSKNGQGQQMITSSVGLTTLFTSTRFSGDATIYAKWTTKKDTPYKVEHYQMNVDGTYPATATQTENLTGETGATEASSARTPTGFEEATAKNQNVGAKILANGSLVVRRYYARKQYTIEVTLHEALSNVTLLSTDTRKTNNFTQTGTMQAYYGDNFYIISDSLREGYENLSWNITGGLQITNSGGNTEFLLEPNPVQQPNNKIELTPTVQLKNYTITYNLNGGTVSPANPTSYNLKTATFTLKNPTKTGYTFKGWTGSNGTTPQTTVTISQGSTGNRTYTANWEQSTYQFTQGPVPLGISSITGTTATGKYAAGTVINLKATVKTGYHFVQWTSSNTSLVPNKVGESYATTSFTMPKGDITMSPVAEGNTYTVEYYDGSSTSRIGYSTHTYGTASNLKTISALGRTRSGYTFYGWSTTENGMSLNHTDGKSVTNLTSVNGGTVKLYALWKATANFYSGEKSEQTKTSTLYYNPTGNKSQVQFPSALALTGKSLLGYVGQTFATSSASASAGALYTQDSEASKNYYALYDTPVVCVTRYPIIQYSSSASGSGTNVELTIDNSYDGIQYSTSVGSEIPSTLTTGWSNVNSRVYVPADHTLYLRTYRESSSGAALYSEGYYILNPKQSYFSGSLLGGKDFYQSSARYTNHASGSDTTYGTPASSIWRMGNARYNSYGRYSANMPSSMPEIKDIYSWTPAGWTDVDKNYVSEPKVKSGSRISSTGSIFYAVYERGITIGYDENGGSGITSPQTGIQYYHSAGSTTKPTFALRANGFTKAGSIFDKWAAGSTSGSQYPAGSTYRFDNKVRQNSWKTMYALWKKQEDAVTNTRENWDITVNSDGTGAIKLYKGSIPTSASIVIPNVVDGVQITGLSYYSAGIRPVSMFYREEDYNKTYYYNSTIKKIEISEGIQRIEANAIGSMFALTEVKIPNSVTFISSNNFVNCPGLTRIIYGGTQSQWVDLIRDVYGTNHGLKGKTIQCSDGNLVCP